MTKEVLRFYNAKLYVRQDITGSCFSLASHLSSHDSTFNDILVVIKLESCSGEIVLNNFLGGSIDHFYNVEQPPLC